MIVQFVSAGFWLAVRVPRVERMWDSPRKVLLDCFLLLGALLVYHHRERFSKASRWLLLAGYVLVVSFACWQVFQLMQVRVRIMPQWDFRVFWAYGHLMSQGQNVYATSSYETLYQEFTPDRDFVEAVMHVGATYPPPTMFLFRPLGCCKVQTAYRYWYVFLVLCMAVSTELMRRIFLKGSGFWGFLFVLLLLLSLYGTWDTIRFGQTNFLALILFLLYWRDREKPCAGLWIALGAVVKLYFGVLLLDSLIFKRWRALVCAFGGGLALAIASLLLLGPATFISYFTLRPPNRVPAWVYIEWMNQSLLGTILRVTKAPIVGGALASNPWFLLSAFALVVSTVWLVYALGPSSERGLSLWIVLALVIYPGTLAHYSVMLLPVLLLLWKERGQTAVGLWGTALFITLVVGLVGFHSHSFFAYIVCWVALAGLTLSNTAVGPQTPSVSAQG
jgi:hypothetical protein